MLEICEESDLSRLSDHGITPANATPPRIAERGQWPEPLRPEAYHGIVGEIVRMIEPHSEADPVALLIHLLVAFGNIVGRTPHFVIGGTTHHTNLNCVVVGVTASRKGTAKDDTFFLIRNVDGDWCGQRVQSGLSSGEGFVWAVRDELSERQPIRERGKVVDYQDVIVDAGVADKRLLVVEPEFASVLRVLQRDGNTLSAQMRQAWDCGDLRILTKAKSAVATGAHISIIGHITKEELLKYLGETEQANGFANRILWVCVHRSKLLPRGGGVHRLRLAELASRLRAAADFARSVGAVSRDEAADAIWDAVYGDLVGDQRRGMFGAVTARAPVQVLRLALIYALLEKSRVIKAEHLNAALGVWSYCEASAQFVFGSSIGDPTADEIMRALRVRVDGMTRTEINKLFAKNKKSADIERALNALAEQGRATYRMENEGLGRPAERWKVL